MKKPLLFFLAILSIQLSNAQITYTDFGDEGWVIPINSNTAVDVDSDGITDFYVNGWDDELGVVPITFVGCFTSPGFILTDFGARELKQHEAGDVVALTTSNEFDYIDDNRGSAFRVGHGFAEGWEDMADYHVGFVVIINYTDVRHGWMKVAFDETNLTTIIKEMAYTEPTPYYSGQIVVGDKGATSTGDLNHVLNEVKIAPNPAIGYTQLEFNYTSNQDLTINIYNAAGQLVHPINNALNVGTNIIRVPLNNLAAGQFLVRFENKDGIHTEKIVVNN